MNAVDLLSSINYDRIANDPWLGWSTFIAFWLALIAIGYCALYIKDNRGRVRLSMLFTLTVAVAMLCMIIKMWLYVPTK